MRIKPYTSAASPNNMVPDVFNSAPNFTLGAGKLLGFETPFWKTNSIVSSTVRGQKGITLFSGDDSSTLLRGRTMYAPESESAFTSNSDAYNYGRSRGVDFKYSFGDFEGLYGDVNNFTTRDRVSNFGKGVMDVDGYFGQWVDAMHYFTEMQVWSPGAISFYNSPSTSGIGNQGVSIGGVLHDYVNMNISIGYGVDLSQGYSNFDPEAALYNYIHRFRAIARMKQVGLIPHVQKQIGFLAGYCDGFGTDTPLMRHRIYLDSPYNPGSYIYIDNYTEESLATMESYAIWGILEGDGIWYWNSGTTSNVKNDVIDIVYSGFPLTLCGFSGSPSPPTPFGPGSGNRPTPNRSYNAIDGLSTEEQFLGAHKISQITDILDGGVQTDSAYSYKRPGGSWISVTKPVNGYGIVEDYAGRRPLVKKIVKGNQVAWVCCDPNASNYSVTQLKLSHAGKQWLVSLQDQRTEIFKYNF